MMMKTTFSYVQKAKHERDVHYGDPDAHVLDEEQKEACQLDRKALNVIENATGVTASVLDHFINRYSLDLGPLKETRVGDGA